MGDFPAALACLLDHRVRNGSEFIVMGPTLCQKHCNPARIMTLRTIPEQLSLYGEVAKICIRPKKCAGRSSG